MSVLEQLAAELQAILSGPYPKPKGAASLPYGDDGIIPLNDALGQMVAGDGGEGGQGDGGEGDGDGRMDWREAGYQTGASHPFVCHECVNIQEDSSCDLVHGPYHNGYVGEGDVCRYWSPIDPPGAWSDMDESEGPMDGDEVTGPEEEE